MGYLDELTSAVVGSFDGTHAPEDLWRNAPASGALTSPWQSEWGFTNRPIPQSDFKRQVKLPRPTNTTFHDGDDLADNVARSRGVNPQGGGVVGIAQSQIGAPYVWAVENPVGVDGGPGSGFDCSGFSSWVYKRAYGVDLPHLSSAQQDQLAPVSKERLKAGDLVFFHYSDRNGPGATADHVGVYAGNGQMVAASSSADQVTLQNVDWAHFVGGGAAPGSANTPSELRAAGVSSARGMLTPKLTGGKGKGKVGDLTPDELTVPFSESFGSTVGNLFTAPHGTATTQGAVGTGDVTGTITMKSPTADLQAAARQMVMKMGWTEKDYRSLVALWDRESGWNPAAKNSIGALGIPQAYGHTLPEGYKTDPLVQIEWGLNYIRERYGSPTAALAHSDREHWY